MVALSSSDEGNNLNMIMFHEREKPSNSPDPGGPRGVTSLLVHYFIAFRLEEFHAVQSHLCTGIAGIFSLPPGSRLLETVEKTDKLICIVSGSFFLHEDDARRVNLCESNLHVEVAACRAGRYSITPLS